MSNSKTSSIQAMLRNWKTSVLAILPTGLALAIAFGWISLEQQQALINGVSVIFDNADNILNEVGIAISSVMSVALLFARDADKSSQDSGIR